MRKITQIYKMNEESKQGIEISKKTPIPANYTWRNPEYKAMAENLPQFQYTNGWIDSIGDVMGWRTGQDKARDEYLNTNANLMSQLVQLDQETAYNSAEQQAARQRAAGLNPDLTGGVSAGEAGNVDNQAAAPPDSGEPETAQIISAIGHVTQFAGTLISGVSTAIAAANTLNGMEIADAGLRNQVYSEVGELIKGRWKWDNNENTLTFKSPYFTNDYDIYKTSGDENELPGVGINAITWKTFDSNPLVREKWHSKRQRKYAYRAFNDILGNLNTKTNAQNDIVSYRESNENLGKSAETETQESVQAARNFYRDVQPYLYKIREIEAQLTFDFNNRMKQLNGGVHKAEGENAQYKYASGYYGNLKPSDIAGYQNVQAQKGTYYMNNLYWDERIRAENNANHMFNQNVEVTVKLNSLYNDMMMHELHKIATLKDSLDKGIHLIFLQTLQSGKAGNMSVLNGMKTISSMNLNPSDMAHGILNAF